MQLYANDPLGNALKAHLSGRGNLSIQVQSDTAEHAAISVPYLFRSYAEMPPVEQKALDLCKGKVLDIGGGAGPHALYLQDRGLDVTSIDSSKGAVETMRFRGVHQVLHEDIFGLRDARFDTLLMLMNGVGLCGSLTGLRCFLQHAKQLLEPEGQLLLDSSDLIQVIEGEPPEDRYYGEIRYRMEFEGAETEWFDWLYLPFELLCEKAGLEGVVAERVVDGADHAYLARLTLT